MGLMKRARSRKRAGGDRENGAALVEMAMVLPLLLLLVLGIIEFGMVLAQMNEIRHGAREGARYAAVSRPDYTSVSSPGTGDNGDVLAVTCDSINLPGVTVNVLLDPVGSPGPARLEFGTLTVVADTQSLSGVPFISGLLPDTLTNSAKFRLEQNANWTGFVSTQCPP